MMKKTLTLSAGGAVAALMAAPVVTVPGAIPHPISSSVAYTSLASSTVEEPSDAEPGTETREVTPKNEFSLVGVVWDEDDETGDVEVRVRENGGEWSQWFDASPMEEGPDPDTEEARNERPATEPILVNEGQSVQVRVPESEAHVLEDASIVTIDPGTSAQNGLLESKPLASANAASAMPEYETRSDWGADESKRNCRNPSYNSTVQAVTMHHTAGTNNYSPATAAAQVRSVYLYHTDVRDWCDIGYNAVVDKFGTIYEGRAGGFDEAVRGAHAKGYNSYTWGIALLGDNNKVNPSSDQMDAMAKLMAWKLSSYDRDPQGKVTLKSRTVGRINGHRDLGSTTCPGGKAYHQLPSLRDNVSKIIEGDVESSGIMAEWERLGGKNGYYGEVVTPVTDLKGGSYARFQKGSIFKTDDTLKHTIGAVNYTYFRTQGPRGPLGFPLEDEKKVDGSKNGVAQKFEHGGIFYTPGTGAHAVFGLIHHEWQRMGGAEHFLGFPTGPVRPVPDYPGNAQVQRFQGGDIYWSPSTGAKFVPTPQAAALRSSGGPAKFGIPKTNPWAVAGGSAQRFEKKNGYIYGSPKSGYHMVANYIRDAYVASGGPGGDLGWPLTDEFHVDGGRAQRFSKGKITWNVRTGETHVVLW